MRKSFFKRQGNYSIPAFTAALLAAEVLTTVHAQVQTAGTVFVNVDATALPEGALESITNNGTLGGVFAATGAAADVPRIATVGGTKGIQFDGTDYLQHMTAVGGSPLTSPAGLTGEDATRSIEVWALNPDIAGEETLVSWGHRGGAPDGSNMSFNYGSDFRWGAAGQWGNPDIGWNDQGGAPVANHWHYLVYTFDGTTTRVYADGVFQNGEYLGPGVINTHPDTTILIAAQTEPDGVTVTGGLRLSGTIARVRVHDGVLTSDQIAANYNLEKAAFVDPVTPTPPVVTPARLTKAPVHRYSFSEAAGDATGKTFSDGAGTANGEIQGNGATFNGSRLVLAGGASGDAAYGDLPNGLLSSNAVANGGSGGFTFETWARFTGNQNWSRVFDFGSSGTQGIGTGGDEIIGAGGNGNGVDYFMLSAQIGGDVNNRRFEIRNDDGPDGQQSVLSDIPTRTFNTDTHLVATWDESTGKVDLYENGVRTGGFTTTYKMSDINDVNVWLGRSNWTADNDAQVEYDEVRLYDYALTAGQALGNYQAGPNVLNNADAAVKIVTQPESVTTDETGTAVFRATVSGSSPVTLQWFRDGTAIPGANSSVLTLNNVTAADNNAKFTLQASNTVSGAASTVTTDPVTLTVKTPVVTLKHRYSFDETSGTTVTDSVSGKNGTVIGGGTFGGGQLTLNGTDAYVDLPNGLITALGSDATFEMWITHQGRAIWSRVFDFGASVEGEDQTGTGQDFLFFTPSNGDGYPRFVANFPDGGDLVTLDPAPPGWVPGNQEIHVAFAWSASGNISRMFINGVPVATGNAPKPLSAMNNLDVNNWLGKSQFNDPLWPGKFNEFRIYTGAMTPSQVAASFAAGPSGGNSGGDQPSLSVSTSGNNIVITWPASATGFNLEGSPALGTGATWTVVSGAVAVGDKLQATVPMAGKVQFFRLHKP